MEEVADLKARYREGRVGDVEVKRKLIEAHKRKFAAARARRVELQGDMDWSKELWLTALKKPANLRNKL